MSCIALPEPKLPAIGQTYDIIVTGVGGTGVVTIGGILGMAAHLEGKGVGVLDMAGLAQKGGAVYSHMRIAERPEDIHAIRIAAGGADLVLGGDIVVAGNKKVLAAVKHGTTEMVINLAEFLPGDFTRNADFSLPTERLKRAILADAGREKTHFIDASRAASALFGNTVGANIFLVGYAYQLGAIPLAAASIEQAIELNGEAVEMNKAAFHWGRRAAARSRRARGADQARAGRDQRRAPAFAVARRDGRAPRRLPHGVSGRAPMPRAIAMGRARRRRPKRRVRRGKSGLAEAVARYLFKLMAYKDEYEVARLYADGAFAKQVENELGGERSAPACASGAAAARAQRQDHRRAEEDDLRPVDLPAVRAAGEVQVPARHRVRSVRLFGGAQDRARAGARLRGHARGGAGEAQRRTTTTSRWGSPRSRRKSAASATSSCATSRPPRPTRPRCSISSAPGLRRCSRRRSSWNRGKTRDGGVSRMRCSAKLLAKRCTAAPGPSQRRFP